MNRRSPTPAAVELVNRRRADKRIDAIAPIIAWHSLLTSLYKEETVQGRLGEAALVSLGIPRLQESPGPAQSRPRFASGGERPASSAPRTAPGSTAAARRTSVERSAIPTFLVEGTADTLFTLHEAITNYAILRATACRRR
jgi:ABC-2 type transport system ATP-binding protein